MKKILITGANSYIGTAFEAYMKQWPELYWVDTLDMYGDAWREDDFSFYDVVYHVAGIAHSDTGHITPEKEAYYRAVNTDLAVETARKAKADGVGQFIFMSSAIVYGNSAPIGKQKVITKSTPPSPANCYGDSKLQAENGILPLADEHFKVVILRSPMIYGKNCKGNFPVLEKLALRLPLFPKIENQRSMLYIGNLVEFVRLMIENEESGIFWPCNKEYSNTSSMVKMIAEAQGKRMPLLPGCAWLLKGMSLFSALVNKAFGNVSYAPELGEYPTEYRRYNLEDSVKETVSK